MAKIVGNAGFSENSEFLEPTTFLFGACRNSKMYISSNSEKLILGRHKQCLPVLLPFFEFFFLDLWYFFISKGNFWICCFFAQGFICPVVLPRILKPPRGFSACVKFRNRVLFCVCVLQKTRFFCVCVLQKNSIFFRVHLLLPRDFFLHL